MDLDGLQQKSSSGLKLKLGSDLQIVVLGTFL
jgi:hypothetical protein